MKRIAKIVALLLLAVSVSILANGCKRNEKPSVSEKKALAEKANKPAARGTRAAKPVKPASLEAKAGRKVIFADSLGSITNLCYARDYRNLSSRSCFSANAILKAFAEKDPKEPGCLADLHFAYGMKLGHGPLAVAEYKKALELEPEAPYPALELFVEALLGADTVLLEEARFRVEPLFKDPAFMRTLCARLNVIFEYYRWGNEGMADMAAKIGEDYPAFALMAARECLKTGKQDEALALCQKGLDSGECKREWLSLLQAIDRPQAAELQEKYGLEKIEFSEAEKAQSRLAALEAALFSGRMNWFSDVIQQARYDVMMTSTNASERSRAASAFMGQALDSQEGLNMVSEYMERIGNPKSTEEYQEFQNMLSSLKNADQQFLAKTILQDSLLKMPAGNRGRLVAASLCAGIEMDEETVKDVLEESPNDVRLLKAVASSREERGDYEGAAACRRQLLELAKNPSERQEALVNLSFCYERAGLEGELSALMAEAQDLLLQEGDIPGQIAFHKMVLVRGDTNGVFSAAAEEYLASEAPEARAMLLDFLCSFEWNTILNGADYGARIARKAVKKPVNPLELQNFGELVRKLSLVKAKGEALAVLECGFKMGICPENVFEVSECFSDEESYFTAVKGWLASCSLSPKQIRKFFPSLVWDFKGEKALELAGLLWERLRNESSGGDEISASYLAAIEGEGIGKETKERHAALLLKDLVAMHGEGRAKFDTMSYALSRLAKFAGPEEKRQIMDMVLERAGGQGHLEGYMLGQLCEMAAAKEDRERLEAVLQSKYSRENLEKSPQLLGEYVSVAGDSGIISLDRELVKDMLQSLTNLSALANSDFSLTWRLENLGLKEEAGLLWQELLENPKSPWFMKMQALERIKDPKERNERKWEVAEEMPEGSGKNSFISSLMSECEGEKDQEKFMKALDYLEGSDQEEIWSDLFRRIIGSEYPVDAESVFAAYAEKFGGKLKPEELENNLGHYRLDYYKERGNYEKAIEAAEKLLQSGGDKEEDSGNLAELYMKVGQPDKAKTVYENLLASYDEAVRDGDTSKKSYALKALEGLKNLAENGEGALDPRILESVLIGSEPSVSDYRDYFRLADGLIDEKSLSDHYEKAITLAGKDSEKAEFLTEYSEKVLGFGDTNACLKIMKRGLEINYDGLESYVSLLAKCGQKEEALKAGLEAFSKMDAEDAAKNQRPLRDKLVDMCIDCGNKEEAWNLLKGGISENVPDWNLNPDSFISRAKKLGKLEEATEELAKRLALSSDQNMKKSALSRACRTLMRNDPEAAKKLADEYVSNMGETSPSSAHSDIQICLSSSTPEKGLEIIRKQVESGQPGYLNQAVSYFQKNRDNEGALDFLKTLKDTYDVKTAMAQIYQGSKDEGARDEAVRLYKEAYLCQEAEDYQKNSALGSLKSLATGGKEPDMALVNDLADIYRNDQSLSQHERLDNLASLYESAGDTTRALNAYSELMAQAKDPDQLESARDRYAECLIKDGQTAKAADCYREMLAAKGADQEGRDQIREKLIKLYEKDQDTLRADNLRRERISEYRKQLLNFPYGSKADEIKAKIAQEEKALEHQPDKK